MEERMITVGFAIYPSTKDKMQVLKDELDVTWDELFIIMLQAKLIEKVK